MYGIALVITVILIFITILALPISLNVVVKDKTSLTLELVFFKIPLTKSDRNSKKKKSQTKTKARQKPLDRIDSAYKMFRRLSYLISRSHVTVEHIIITDTTTLSKGGISSQLYMITASSLLAYIRKRARKFTFKAPEYVIAKDDIDQRLIDITLSFFLIDVIIFLLMLAYLKLKSKLRRK